MQSIFHPIFDTLYIDPENGVYWDSHVDLYKRQVPIAMLIENAKDVTEENIRKAAKFVKNIESISRKTQKKLPDIYTQEPAGACWEYYTLATESMAIDAQQELFKQVPTSPQTFLTCLHPLLVAIYPAEAHETIIIDFSVGEEHSAHVLSVCLDQNGEIVDLSVEEN